MEIKKVGVVGCGLMGAGIAQVCAESGYDVVISEINEDLLNKGMDGIERIFTRDARKGRISEEEKSAIMARLSGTTDIQSFSDCDLVIEAVVENMELKKKIFTSLDEACPEGAILASNTSCLSIIDMAKVTSRPEKVLGLHFFNPVPSMKLMELVRSIAVVDEVVDVGRKFGESLGKTVIIAPDSPGFIVNRLLMPFMLGAFQMLESGGATKEDIDTGVKLGLGHPMGPLALADLIGIDTVLFIANAIFDELKNSLYAPPIILKKMVAAGWLGRKTGKGFYDY
ncbi:3-hydroxyacyl-CoA dehydrogenase family protein [Chloroflexota bacterium]